MGGKPWRGWPGEVSLFIPAANSCPEGWWSVYSVFSYFGLQVTLLMIHSATSPRLPVFPYSCFSSPSPPDAELRCCLQNCRCSGLFCHQLSFLQTFLPGSMRTVLFSMHSQFNGEVFAVRSEDTVWFVRDAHFPHSRSCASSFTFSSKPVPAPNGGGGGRGGVRATSAGQSVVLGACWGQIEFSKSL